jgi:hypothetical protein
MLRAARMIIWGNALGIPLGSLRSRVRGSADPGVGRTAHEIGTLLGSALVTPVAVLHAMLEDLRGVPIGPCSQARCSSDDPSGTSRQRSCGDVRDQSRINAAMQRAATRALSETASGKDEGRPPSTGTSL